MAEEKHLHLETKNKRKTNKELDMLVQLLAESRLNSLDHPVWQLVTLPNKVPHTHLPHHFHTFV